MDNQHQQWRGRAARVIGAAIIAVGIAAGALPRAHWVFVLALASSIFIVAFEQQRRRRAELFAAAIEESDDARE